MMTTNEAPAQIKTKRFIFKCKNKNCKTCPPKAVDVEFRRVVTGTDRWGAKTRVTEYNLPGHGFTRYFIGTQHWHDLARCPNCGSQRGSDEVIGTFSDKHACDARCLSAKGPKCECSCAGANHGSGWL